MNTHMLRTASIVIFAVSAAAYFSYKPVNKQGQHGASQHKSCCGGCSHGKKEAAPQPLVISNACGTVTVTEPVVLELLASPAMERIKNIQQYGVMRYAKKDFYSFTRYDHSVGVFTLLRRFGAPLEEQIAGLLHDVSHTVFSHVADHLFEVSSMDNPYQDDIHEWYLEKQGVPALLARHGLSAAILNPDQPQYRRLEQSLPDLCADRIQYNLAGGLLENMLTQKEVDEILNNLKFENDTWFFTSVESARKFSVVSHQLTARLWGAEWNSCISRWAADALKRAVVLGMVTMDDIHFSTDDKVWAVLEGSNDPEIVAALHKITHYQEYYKMGTAEQHDMFVRAKFSAVDPLVVHEKGLVRLTTLDADYAQQYEQLRKQVKSGYFVTFVKRDVVGQRSAAIA